MSMFPLTRATHFGIPGFLSHSHVQNQEPCGEKNAGVGWCAGKDLLRDWDPAEAVGFARKQDTSLSDMARPLK